MELEFEHFKMANPQLRKGDESYADPNFSEAEAEVDADARIDLSQVGPENDSEEAARERAQAIRDKIAKGIQDDDAEWEDVPVGKGGESV